MGQSLSSLGPYVRAGHHWVMVTIHLEVSNFCIGREGSPSVEVLLLKN